MRVIQEKTLAYETSTMKQSCLSRENAQIKFPTPGKGRKAPQVFLWEERDDYQGFWHRTYVARDEVDGMWSLYPNEAKRFNAFDNEWDVCAAWASAKAFHEIEEFNTLNSEWEIYPDWVTPGDGDGEGLPQYDNMSGSDEERWEEGDEEGEIKQVNIGKSTFDAAEESLQHEMITNNDFMPGGFKVRPLYDAMKHHFGFVPATGNPSKLPVTLTYIC